MNQKVRLFLICALVLVAFVGIYVLYQQLADSYAPSQLATAPRATEASGDASEPFDENSLMPDFTVYDETGEAFRLSDFRGKPVILNFWASWCGPCKSEMPEFQTAFDKYGNDIHFLIVNMTDGMQETVQKASSFISTEGYSFPVYFDLDSEAAMRYNVMSIPTTYFIDENGHGIAWASGALSMDMLEQGVSMLLDEE